MTPSPSHHTAPKGSGAFVLSGRDSLVHLMRLHLDQEQMIHPPGSSHSYGTHASGLPLAPAPVASSLPVPPSPCLPVFFPRPSLSPSGLGAFFLVSFFFITHCPRNKVAYRAGREEGENLGDDSNGALRFSLQEIQKTWMPKDQQLRATQNRQENIFPQPLRIQEGRRFRSGSGHFVRMRERLPKTALPSHTPPISRGDPGCSMGYSDFNLPHETYPMEPAHEN